MLKYSTQHHRTKILPLRWIGNICGGFAANNLFLAALLEEENKIGLRHKYHSLMWVYLNKPYMWWGTYYSIDMEAWAEELDQIKSDMSGSGWDDYDENGIPYWEKDE